jgi:hypothetical protein
VNFETTRVARDLQDAVARLLAARQSDWLAASGEFSARLFDVTRILYENPLVLNAVVSLVADRQAAGIAVGEHRTRIGAEIASRLKPVLQTVQDGLRKATLFSEGAAEEVVLNHELSTSVTRNGAAMTLEQLMGEMTREGGPTGGWSEDDLSLLLAEGLPRLRNACARAGSLRCSKSCTSACASCSIRRRRA